MGPLVNIVKSISNIILSVLRDQECCMTCIFKDYILLRESLQVTFHKNIQHEANSKSTYNAVNNVSCMICYHSRPVNGAHNAKLTT